MTVAVSPGAVTAAPDTASRYIQLAGALRETFVAAGPNTQLPTEEQLAARFHVSRVTVRRALAVLQRSGLISRQRGRGTVVSAPKLTRTLFPACTIEQDFAGQGLAFMTTLIGVSSDESDADVRAQLEVRAREKVCSLEITRSVEFEIICHERRYMRASHLRALDQAAIAKMSVSQLLADAAGVSIASSDIETEILPAPKDVADHLKITAGDLVLVQRFRERLETGDILQFGVMSYRVDRVRFKMFQSGSPFNRSS